jgi:hypothetical protein
MGFKKVLLSHDISRVLQEECHEETSSSEQSVGADWLYQ